MNDADTLTEFEELDETSIIPTQMWVLPGGQSFETEEEAKMEVARLNLMCVIQARLGMLNGEALLELGEYQSWLRVLDVIEQDEKVAGRLFLYIQSLEILKHRAEGYFSLPPYEDENDAQPRDEGNVFQQEIF